MLPWLSSNSKAAPAFSFFQWPSVQTHHGTNLCLREIGGSSRDRKGPSQRATIRSLKHLAFVQASCFSPSWFPTEQQTTLVSAVCLLFLKSGQPWEPANRRESEDTNQRVGSAVDTIHTCCILDTPIFDQFPEVPLLICSFFFHLIPIFRCQILPNRWPWKAPWQRQPWHLVSHSPDLSEKKRSIYQYQNIFLST